MNELEIIQHRQIEGLSVFFDTVEHRTNHIHAEWELLWLLDQPLAVACGAVQFRLEPGQLTLFHPNEPHEFHRITGSATFLCVQVSQKILPAMQPLRVDGKLPHLYMRTEELDAVKRDLAALSEAYFRQEEGFALFCVGKCCLLLHTLLKALPLHILTSEERSSIDRRNARLNRLIAFVEENYMHRIRLEDFAAAEGCSMSYLSRFIKSTLNQSFQDYVASVRFRRACELIAAGGKRMLDICMESGYSDYRYFSRAFREQYGMTPEEYSCFIGSQKPEPTAARRSLHSIERFYSGEESLMLLKKYFP